MIAPPRLTYLRRVGSTTLTSPLECSVPLPPSPFVSSGCVTIDTFVIPDCFTASITLAKAPNGTRSSLRR